MLNWNNMKSVTLVAALAMTSLSGAYAQTTFSDVRQEAGTLIEVMGDYSHDQRVALVDASRATLAGIDDSITAMNTRLRDDWDQMSDAAKADAQAALDDLHARRLAVAEGLGALGHSTASAWADIRVGFSTSFTDLVTAWEAARQEFQTD